MGNTRTMRVGSVASAVRALRDLGMPWAEIDRILATSDPRVVRRSLDLHLEMKGGRMFRRFEFVTLALGVTAALLGACVINADRSGHGPPAVAPSDADAVVTIADISFSPSTVRSTRARPSRGFGTTAPSRTTSCSTTARRAHSRTMGPGDAV